MLSAAAVILAAWGAIVILLGQWGVSTLMAANKCDMTYSMPQFSAVPVQSDIKGYSLLQLVDAKNADQGLDLATILFVPGHGGR